jgi:hypothetical protein
MNPFLQLLNVVSRPHETSSQLEGVCKCLETVILDHEGLADLSAALEISRLKRTAPRGAEFPSKAHRAEMTRVLLVLVALESRALESVNRDPEMARVIWASRATAL